MLSDYLYVVIPVHNRKTFTKSCLLSLSRQTFKNFNTIVIDDGSTDGTADMIVQEFPQVILRRGDGNLWWAAATNLGVQYAMEHHAKYILTLNDDTVASDYFIEKMIYWARRKPNALLGALAVDAKSNNPIYGGEILNWLTGRSIFLLDALPENEQNGIHLVSHYPGRGLLIPAEVFRRVGLYDSKHFPQAVADDDFVFRAVRTGFEVYCNYDAKLFVYPEESGDVKLREKKSFRNYYSHIFGIKGGGNLRFFVIFALKNCPPGYLPLFLPAGVIRRILGYLRDWASEKILNVRK